MNLWHAGEQVKRRANEKKLQRCAYYVYFGRSAVNRLRTNGKIQ